MKTLLRHVIIYPAVLVVLFSACGGDSAPTAPPPPPPPLFPALSGSFLLQASFDNLPTSLANGAGTVTFLQADRNQPGLIITGTLVMVAGGSTGTLSEFRNVALTTVGTVSFQVGSASSTSVWGFDGTLSADGRSIAGRHTLAGSTSSFAGNWTATKQ